MVDDPKVKKAEDGYGREYVNQNTTVQGHHVDDFHIKYNDQLAGQKGVVGSIKWNENAQPGKAGAESFLSVKDNGEINLMGTDVDAKHRLHVMAESKTISDAMLGAIKRSFATHVDENKLEALDLEIRKAALDPKIMHDHHFSKDFEKQIAEKAATIAPVAGADKGHGNGRS